MEDDDAELVSVESSSLGCLGRNATLDTQDIDWERMSCVRVVMMLSKLVNCS